MDAMNNCCVPYPARNDKYDDLINEFPQLLTEEALDIIRKQYYDALSSLCHEKDLFKKIGSAIFAANIYDLIGVIEFKLIDKGIDDMDIKWGDSIREHETTTFEPQNEDSRGYANTFKCTYCGCLVTTSHYMRTGQFDYNYCPYCGRPVESEDDAE